MAVASLSIETSAAAPLNPEDVGRKDYVDSQVATRATTAYVDSQVATRVANGDQRLSVKPYPPVVVTYAGTGTYTYPDPTAGTHFRITATGICYVAMGLNPVDGQVVTIEFTSSGGAYTFTPYTGAPTANTSGGFVFGTDITALSATTSGATDYVQAVFHATPQRWRVIGYVKGY